MMIKYKTTDYNPYIEKVTVIKETDYFLTLQETAKNGTKYCQRYRKVTENYQFFDTWQDAKNHLIGVAVDKIAMAEINLKRAKHELASMKDLGEV